MLDLSNEVLYIDFGQGATKISEVKVGGRKKYLFVWPGRASRFKPMSPGSAESADIFFDLQL